MNKLKRKICIVVLIILTLIVSGCTRKNDINETASSYNGTYFYDNSDDSADQKEDHYIVLDCKNNTIDGYYYGTTDDFDPAREGYLPGYYVSKMKNLKIEDNRITFTIQLSEKDIFSKPIDLAYTDSAAILIEENKRWDNSQIFRYKGGISKEYSGTINKSKISLGIEETVRVFSKMK